MCNKFRVLTADEIECRVAQVGKAGQRVWASILIYKDARVDQKLLDEVIGPMNWKNEYSIIDGNLYCAVSIWDKEKGEWISKQNVGTESNTEKEKGQASDAFKRACFNWGIGRELYTAPKIFLDLKVGEYREENGKIKCTASFFVAEIGYNEGTISRLVIVDKDKTIRYSYGPQATKTNAPAPVVWTGDTGATLTEGGRAWIKAAQRVAAGEEGVADQMQSFFNVNAEGMSRFFDLVNQLRTNNNQ